MYCIASASFELMSTLRRTAPAEIDSACPRHSAEERRGALLVEPFVEIAALRALDARWAPALAGAAVEHLQRVRHPALELVEPALGDADSARMSVVDEDRGPAGVRMDVRREAADVPAIAHRPERQQRDHRVLRGVEGGEEGGHRLETLQLRIGRHVPDRLCLEDDRR